MQRYLIATMLVSLVCFGFWIAEARTQPGQDKTTDKDKKETKPKEDGKDKEKEPTESKESKEPKMEPETPVQAYARLLGSEDSPVVRKRIVIALKNMGKEAKAALPALLLAGSAEEKDPQVRATARATVKELFDAPEVVEALTLAVRDAKLDSAARCMSCKGLAAYYSLPSIAKDKQKEAYQALESTLAEADDELRLAAANALEAIDRKSLGVQRIVRIRLNTDSLRQYSGKAEDIFAALKKTYPNATIEWLVPGLIIQWMPTDPDDATALKDLGRAPVLQRPEGAILLREFATITEATPAPEKK